MVQNPSQNLSAAALAKAIATPALYRDWREAPWSATRWPHFPPLELACKCAGRFCHGEYYHDPSFLDGLEGMRQDAGRALIINSGRRCERHNAAVGGARESLHKRFIAADIGLAGHDPVALARSAQRRGFRGIGFGKSFLHVDQRPEAKTAFHYPGGEAAWTARFGFDPVARIKAGGLL